MHECTFCGKREFICAHAWKPMDKKPAEGFTWFECDYCHDQRELRNAGHGG